MYKQIFADLSKRSIARKFAAIVMAVGLLTIGFSFGLRLLFLYDDNQHALTSELTAIAAKLPQPLTRALTYGKAYEVEQAMIARLAGTPVTELVITIDQQQPLVLHTLNKATGLWQNRAIHRFPLTLNGHPTQVELHAARSVFANNSTLKLVRHLLVEMGTVTVLALSTLIAMKTLLLNHLETIASYAGSRSIANLSVPLKLDRPSDAADELDRVVEAFEFMRMTLNDDIEQRHIIEMALMQEKSLKLEHRRLVEEAKAANKAKSEFLATMSHEIRTPMNGVMGMVEMLKDTPLTGNQRHYLEVLHRSGESLLEIINDILDYSKIESGRMSLEHIEFNLEELIDTAMRLFSASASKRDLETLCNIMPEVPTHLLGDPTRVRQILVNLIGNALKFTSEGFIALKVELERLHHGAAMDTATLKFSVRDSGIGVPKEDQAHLFEAFRQADSSTTRRYGGSGLGLNICKQLAQLMGGDIGVLSEVDSGSTFWFSAQFELAPEAANTTHPPSCSLDLSGKRLLAVAPSEAMLGALREHCPGWNVQVLTAPTFDTAYAQLAKGEIHCDIIALNHRTKSDAAFEFAEKLRRLEAFRDTTILLLSNLQGSPFSNEQLRHISAVVVRPLTMHRFNEALIEHVHGAKLNPLLAELREPERDFADLRVLVAEDNAVNRLVITGLLGKMGIKPDFAENGAQAVARFISAEPPYQLILMDCEMPEMDGYTATANIRADETSRALTPTPIVALTAHVEASHRERVFACGMNQFLSKPITLKKLEDALDGAGLKRS